MKSTFKLSITCLFFCLSFITQAQTYSSATENEVKRGCGTIMPPPEWDVWFNSKVEEYQLQLSQNKTQVTSLTIPVVVHVIHGGQSVGGFPNISATQVKSQIGVLNKDFAGSGVNSNNLASTGFSLVGAANCLVTFCLAQFDPSGNPLNEPGIDRINYVSKGWSNPASMGSTSAFMNLMDNTIKPASIWDPTQYFNIWVSDVNNSVVGILGYATFPNGSGLVGINGNLGNANSDGIWVWSRSFGTSGAVLSPYNLGRTATHETGHWLGLRHIGGDASNPSGDCNATDYCNDTPPQKGGYNGGSNGQNFSFPSYPLNVNECGSPYGNMFMNFMDYTDDAAMYMFTPDQNSRIQTAMQNGYFRNQLSASSSSLCGGVPYADILLDTILCVNSNINALNQSYGDAPLTYSWVATPSAGVTFSPSHTVASPIMNFSSIGGYTLTTTISNSIGVSVNTTEVRLEDCTGISKYRAGLNQLLVSPNPSNGFIQINFVQSISEESEIRIFNSLGELILIKKLTVNEGKYLDLDLTSFPNGIYNLTVSTQNEKMVKRIILIK